MHTKEIIKRRQKEKRENRTPSLLLSCGRHEGSWGGTLDPRHPAPRPQPSAPLPAPSAPCTPIPTPRSPCLPRPDQPPHIRGERKSSTTWLHLPSARRSRILNRLFTRTSAHRIERIRAWFFSLNHCSHATYLDHGERDTGVVGYAVTWLKGER